MDFTPADNTVSTRTAADAPLAALDSAGYSYTNFIYPSDLGAPGAGKDHYIMFHINQSAATQYQTAGGTINDQPTIQAYADPSAGSFSSTISGGNGTGTDGDSGGSVVQTILNNQNTPIQRVATTIVLYMPDSITSAYAADWSANELGFAKDLMGAATGKGSVVDAVSSGLISVLKNLGTTADEITASNFSGTASFNTRLALNNHKEVLFDGIGFRTFEFKFRFAPQNETEALNVDNIIRAFKFYQAPELAPSSAGRFWIYPSEFDISYYSNGQENLFLNRINTSVMTNFAVNYTSSGHWAAHRAHSVAQGSPPMITDISCTFMETGLVGKFESLRGF